MKLIRNILIEHRFMQNLCCIYTKGHQDQDLNLDRNQNQDLL